MWGCFSDSIKGRILSEDWKKKIGLSSGISNIGRKASIETKEKMSLAHKGIVIEVYANYFKNLQYGSCENYEKQRSEYFAKYGYKTIFIKDEEICPNNWKEVCLNKIKNET